MLFLLFIYWNLLPSSASSNLSPVQIIQVRENVNVTMTCRLDASQSVRTTDQRSSQPSLSALNKILDHSLSENIILWYKDDSQVIGVNSISNDPKKYYIYQENFHTYQLTLINVQLESSGMYKCQNFTAKEENRFQVNVMGMSGGSR